MAHAPSLLGLIVALFTYGFTMGIMDVSINSCAILTEIVAGKPLLGTFHGSYSIAAAVGALIGGVLVATQWSIADVFGCISVLTVTLSLAASTLLYNFAQEIKITDIKAEQQASEHEAELGAGRKQLVEQGSTKEGGQTSWLIAFYSIVGFLAAFGESSMLTWSVVYFDRILKVRKEYHSLGFTCFQMSMAVGRFSCDYLRRVVGRRLMFRAAGVLATGGLSLLVLSPMFSPDTRVDGGAASIVAGCVGLSITGLGLSTLIPTSFSSAGHIPGVHPGTAISVVSTFTNAGGILSSPFVGFLSDWFDSLQTALLCDAVLLSIVFVVSWSIPVEDHHRMD
jgi:MFS family permease